MHKQYTCFLIRHFQSECSLQKCCLLCDAKSTWSFPHLSLSLLQNRTDTISWKCSDELIPWQNEASQGSVGAQSQPRKSERLKITGSFKYYWTNLLLSLKWFWFGSFICLPVMEIHLLTLAIVSSMWWSGSSALWSPFSLTVDGTITAGMWNVLCSTCGPLSEESLLFRGLPRTEATGCFT